MQTSNFHVNLRKRIFYLLKPLIPRHLQIMIRRMVVLSKFSKYKDVWPINARASKRPVSFKRWPGGKKFALVFRHDVETLIGYERCPELVSIEKELGFRSSFNFVPERYSVSPAMRAFLTENGFEVGVHGLKHDGKLYFSRSIFHERAVKINGYLRKWGAVGFYSPSAHHNFDWIRELDIEYDSSTFDTDPFEPQPDGLETIFPVWIEEKGRLRGFVELPYTLPQDFTLFILLKEKNIDTWKMKTDWIAQNGGMVLINTHPDYMSFNGAQSGRYEYPSDYYVRFLEYVRSKYGGIYWHALPKDVSKVWRSCCV